MIYDIAILAVGGAATIGAILAARDISRHRVYFVGLVRPTAKQPKIKESSQASLDAEGLEAMVVETKEKALSGARVYSSRYLIEALHLEEKAPWGEHVVFGGVRSTAIHSLAQGSEAKVMEHHGRKLEELEDRIKQLEKQSSPQSEESYERQPANASSRVVH